MIRTIQDIINRKRNYEAVFKSVQGKAVLSDLIKFCGLYDPSFTGNAEQTAFNEGKRRVALRIISILGQNEKSLEQVSQHMNNEG